MNATSSKSAIPEPVRQWWKGTDFRQMERITGFRQADFEPGESCRAFVDACDSYWEQSSDERKIMLWEKYS